MAQKLTASIAENMSLDNQFVIEWAAVDPATGDDVAGVLVSNVGMLVEPVGLTTADALVVGPFMLVPGPAS